MTARKWIVTAFALIMALSCFSCLSEGNDASQEAAHFEQMAAQAFDLSLFEQNTWGLTSEQNLEKAVVKAEVDGVVLELGMPFDEVMAAGFVAPEDYAEAEGHLRISSQSDFLTPNGKKIRLGFNVSQDGEKLSNGTLCYVCRYEWWNEDAADIAIEGITMGTGLPEVVDVMGTPALLSLELHHLQLRYDFNDNAAIGSVTYWIDTDGKVAGMCLDGTLK